jgi:hypothetical protein
MEFALRKYASMELLDHLNKLPSLSFIKTAFLLNCISIYSPHHYPFYNGTTLEYILLGLQIALLPEGLPFEFYNSYKVKPKLSLNLKLSTTMSLFKFLLVMLLLHLSVISGVCSISNVVLGDSTSDKNYISKSRYFSLTISNDIYHRTDWYYTGGIQMEYVTQSLHNSPLKFLLLSFPKKL